MPRRLRSLTGWRNDGFSVVAFSLSVLLLGAAAALALPAVRRAVSDHQREATLDDLRRFAGSFQAYARDHGDWPSANYAPGSIPPGMEKYLADSHWTDPSPIGGRYVWLRHTPQVGGRYAAAIAIVSSAGSRVTNERDPLQGIDRAIDDGDLTTGSFFLGFHDYPVYILEH
jgi:type II secretory pathway pseudopilin PulG